MKIVHLLDSISLLYIYVNILYFICGWFVLCSCLSDDYVWILPVIFHIVEWRRWRLTEARAFAYQKVLYSVALCYLNLIINDFEWWWGSRAWITELKKTFFNAVCLYILMLLL